MARGRKVGLEGPTRTLPALRAERGTSAGHPAFPRCAGHDRREALTGGARLERRKKGGRR